MALFIACSDSGIDPNLLTQTESGELFVLRNAGNIVPPYGPPPGGEAATIVYAVKVLGVNNVIVYGHSHCGAMDAWLRPEDLDGMTAAKRGLKYTGETLRMINGNYQHIAEWQPRLTATVEENAIGAT